MTTNVVLPATNERTRSDVIVVEEVPVVVSLFGAGGKDLGPRARAYIKRSTSSGGWNTIYTLTEEEPSRVLPYAGEYIVDRKPNDEIFGVETTEQA